MDQDFYTLLAGRIYEKASKKLALIAIVGLVLLITVANVFDNGTITFFGFLIFYFGTLSLSVVVQNRQVDREGDYPGLRTFYWKYAIWRRVKILGALGRIIFNIFVKWILPKL